MESEISLNDFEKLMRENGPMIYTLSIRLTGNPSDGQDLAQETFIKAFKSYSGFRGDSAPSTWLYRICINVWKNRVRYEKRRFFLRHFSFQSNQEDSKPPELAAPDPPVESAVEGSELKQALQKALAQLDHQDRVILVMRDMEDKSYEEIGELLEIPMGTVKSRIARGRDRLRQLMLKSFGVTP